MKVLTSKFADDVREAIIAERRLEHLEKQEGIAYADEKESEVNGTKRTHNRNQQDGN